jgi:tripartite-type tricarboxylate transporter receptor subunit TctC
MRKTLILVLAAVGTVGLQIDCRSVSAQTYPAKPVRLIVPYTPGGFTDTMARTVGDKLASALRQPTMIENKPGANGIIGADLVAKSPPDGHTLGMVIAAHSANATLYPKLPFDTVKDFTYVSLVGVTPLILVASTGVPANSIRELIAYAKANPGKVNFESSGIGAAAHLTMEYFMSVTGTKMVHVPYKGTAPALTDLLGGQIGVMFDSPSSMMPHVKAGNRDRGRRAGLRLRQLGHAGRPRQHSQGGRHAALERGRQDRPQPRDTGEVRLDGRASRRQLTRRGGGVSPDRDGQVEQDHQGSQRQAGRLTVDN